MSNLKKCQKRINKRNVEKDTRDVDVLLRFDGKCQWIPPIIYQSRCQTDMINFPFDIQNCSLKFGSWVHSTDYIDIKLHESPVDLSEYSENPEFSLIETAAVRKIRKYECCPKEYTDIFFHLVLRRRSEFYVQVRIQKL